MPRGDMAARGFDVVRGVVEEDVGAEGLQKRALVATAEEQCLVETHAPMAQGEDHALVRGRGTRGDERGADRRILFGKRFLQSMQRSEEAAERAARERLIDTFDLVPVERLDALLLRDALAFVAEDDRIAFDGRIVAAAMPASSELFTLSGLADKNNCAPNERT